MLIKASTLTKKSSRLWLLKWVCRDARRDKKRQDRLCEATVSNRLKQKLQNKQNDVREYTGETRVVIEMVTTSQLPAEKINQGLISRITCANNTQ